MKLNVTAEDMMKGDQNIYYYAVDSAGEYSSAQPSGGIWVKQEGDGVGSAPTGSNIELATIKRNGGSEDETYECKYTVTLTSESTFPSEIVAGDLNLTLEGPYLAAGNSAGLSDAGSAQEGFVGASDSSGSFSKTYTGKVVIPGEAGGEYTEETINATMYLKNDSSKPQNYLANMNLTLSIEVTGAECKVTKNAE